MKKKGTSVIFAREIHIFSILVAMVVLFSSASWAKVPDERGQVILLNDSAAALEESNPRMAKDLTQFADEKENALENNNDGQDAPSAPGEEEVKKQQSARIKLLRNSAAILQQLYPEIAKNLVAMADDMAKSAVAEKK